MNLWGTLFELARERHGVVTTAMAVEVGISAAALRARATREGWHRIARGVWLLPGVQSSHRTVAAAHLELLGERAVCSHQSAAYLHGLRPEAPDPAHLMVSMDRRPEPREGVVVHRSRTLRPRDVVEVEGLRATSVPRTLRDLAAGSSWEATYDLVTDAEQRRLVRPQSLLDTMHRLHHGPGSGIFRQVVQQRQADRSDSALERDTRDAATDAGFEPTAGPFPVRARTGALLRLDVAFPTVWFAIECDGFGFHRNRQAFERDRERWRLIQQAGWRLTWVTRRRLRDDFAGLLEEIAEAHRLADPQRPPAIAAS